MKQARHSRQSYKTRICRACVLRPTHQPPEPVHCYLRALSSLVTSNLTSIAGLLLVLPTGSPPHAFPAGGCGGGAVSVMRDPPRIPLRDGRAKGMAPFPWAFRGMSHTRSRERWGAEEDQLQCDVDKRGVQGKRTLT